MATNAQYFMSPEELAEYLGVPVASVYGWRYKRSGPPAVKVGRHVRYRKVDVEKWLDDHADQHRSA